MLLISEIGKKPDGGRKLEELVSGPDTLVVDVRVQLEATGSGWGLYSNRLDLQKMLQHARPLS